MKERIRRMRPGDRKHIGNRELFSALGLAAVGSAFSTWTVFARFGENTLAFLPEQGSKWLMALFLVLFAGIYAVWCLTVRKRKSLPALWAALTVSLCHAAGTFVLQDLNTLEKITLPRLFFRLLGMLPVFYCILSAVFSLLDDFHPRRRKGGMAERKQIRRILILIIVLLWLPYAIGCFPGNMTADTLKSVESFQDPMQGRNVPWFLNLLYGGFLLLGERAGNVNAALFVFCLLQIMLFVFGLANLLSRLWAEGVPRGVLVPVLMLLGIVPVFSTYAFCTMKDAVFAVGILYFCDAGTGILASEETEKRDWVQLGVSAVFTALTRGGAALMMILSLAGFFVLFRSRRIFLTGMAAIILLCNYGIPKLAGLPGSQVRENLSLPIQQTARVLKLFEEDLTKEEIKQYKKIMTLKQWRRYKAGISDPVKKYFAEDPSGRYLKDYITLWRMELNRHPYAYLEAALLMNYAYYVPLADRSDLKERLFLGTERFSTEKVESLKTLRENGNPGLDVIRRIYDGINRIPVLRLFTRIGLYSWLMLIAFIYGLARKKQRRFVLLLVPELIVLIGCCFSPVNGHLRYAFPFMINGPLVSMVIFFVRDPSRMAEEGL